MAGNAKWLYLVMLYHCVFKVFSVVESPGDITVTVEDKEARFLWNATASIDEAKWGLFEANAVAPFFIRVNKKIGEQKSVDLDDNSSKAFPYKNRIHFIGNISRGWAWFVLKNLSIVDSKEYAADIKESGAAFKVYRVKLKVLPAPTTVPPTTIATNTNATVTSSNGTSNETDKPKTTTTTATPTTTSALGTGEIVGIVIGVLVVIAIIVGVVVWYVKKKKDKKKGLRIPMS